MVEFWSWLWGWPNAPFLVALGVSVGLVAIDVVSGGLSDLLHLDVDVDHDLHGGGLGWLGFGKAPVSILLEVLLGIFGVAGLVVQAVAHDLLPGSEPLVLLGAVPVAAVAAMGATRLVGGAIAAWIPRDDPAPRLPEHYVGQLGRVTVAVDARSGEVEVHLPGEPPAYLLATAEVVLPRGAEVVVTDFDPERRAWRVGPVPTL